MFLKQLTLNGQSDKAFLLTSKFCPEGVVCPAPGLYTCGKTLKNMYKIKVERDLFETCRSKAVLLLWFLTVLAVCVYTLVHLLC